jgi:rRNA-processing protein FCF1
MRDEIREAKIEINHSFGLISQLNQKFDELKIMDPAIRQQIERISTMQDAAIIPKAIHHELEELKHAHRSQQTEMQAEALQTNTRIENIVT